MSQIKNAGHDTVEVPAKFDNKNPISPYTGGVGSEIAILDDVTIVGLGNSKPVIDDQQRWVTTDGLLNAGYPFDTNAIVIRPAGLLFRVNRSNAAGRTISVEIKNLAFTHLSSLINSDNANVVLNNVWVYQNTAQNSSDLLIVHGNGGSLTIKNSLIFENTVADGEQIILVNNDLNIINSAFSSNYIGVQGISSSRLILMDPSNNGTAIIRNSYFDSFTNSALEYSEYQC